MHLTDVHWLARWPKITTRDALAVHKLVTKCIPAQNQDPDDAQPQTQRESGEYSANDREVLPPTKGIQCLRWLVPLLALAVDDLWCICAQGLQEQTRPGGSDNSNNNVHSKQPK